MNVRATHAKATAACDSESTRHAAILRRRGRPVSARIAMAASLALAVLPDLGAGDTAEEAEQILVTAGATGGLVVHLGCGDGQLTAALRANERFVVQGLDSDPDHVLAAQRHIQDLGLYGPVSVRRLRDPRGAPPSAPDRSR